jgi:transglutaminase-like putative cysteine protease
METPMLIRAGYHIEMDCEGETPLVLMLSVHPSQRAQLVSQDRILTSPPLIARAYRDSFGHICHRLTARPGPRSLRSDFLVEDPGAPDPVAPDSRQHPIEALPDGLLQFRLPSRYCDTEALLDIAWAEFARVPEGWRRVQAIVDFTHERIAFGYSHASPTRTASEAHHERRGVCRDFAHLAITLCRAMNIPARYVNGYLGDIGVPALPSPMDFSAWFQVWLDGRWWSFDARHNMPRIGRILIAAGRDAADVAMTTSFGPTRLTRFDVITEEVEPFALERRA